MNAMKAMNASLISLCSVNKCNAVCVKRSRPERAESQLCCVTYVRLARDHLLQNESEQSYQNLSFTLKMI
jgi:hypothetical protein